jgi:hypothetical protein
MKSHDAIKKKAYAKAMENGRKEGEILATAMNLKLGKVIGVSTESLGIEEILPVMLRKELSRELRRGDNLKPELYQFMQEYDMNQFIDSKYGKEERIFSLIAEQTSSSKSLYVLELMTFFCGIVVFNDSRVFIVQNNLF